MATQNKFNDFAEQLGLAEHNLNTDLFKVMLTNVLPVATNTIKTNITEITAGNGYVAGGDDITNLYSENPAATGEMTAVDVTFTASGGTIGPFRYAVLYNDTNASKRLMSWFDHGSAVTLADGESFTVDFGANLMTLT